LKRKKKKKSFTSLPSFRLVKPRSPPSPAARLLPRAWPSPAPPRFPCLGRALQAPAAQFARAPRFLLCVSLTSRPRMSNDAFFFSRPCLISFPVPPTESFPPNLSSLIGASPSYISQGRTPIRLHPIPLRCQQSSRDATTSLELYHVTTVRPLELHTVSGPTLSPFPTLVSSPCSLLHPGAFLSRGNTLNHEIAFSDDGATVGLVVVTVFGRSPAVG
jgi:hypothetical protein